MSISAAIFDLDNTLAMTTSLKDYRENHDIEGLNAYLSTASIQLFGNIRNLLEILRENSIPLGIVTNSPKWYADILLNHLNIKEYFQTIITYTDVGPAGAKPSRLGIWKAMEVLNVTREAENVLYVGDEGHDIIAAYEAGVLPILPSWASRKPVTYTPGAVLSTEVFSKYFNSIDEFYLIAERAAEKGTFHFEKPQVNFLPLDEMGNIITVSDNLAILCFGRYFSQKSLTTAKLHDNHKLSLDIFAKETAGDSYEVPKYWIEIFSHAIQKIPLYPQAKISKFDILSVIPAKQGKNKRLEKMLNKISELNPEPQAIEDLFMFDEEAESLKNLAKDQRYNEVSKHLHINEKYLDVIQGSVIFLMDDVITTGSTFTRARELLLEAGADKVVGSCIAKTVSLQRSSKSCPNCHAELRLQKNSRNGSRFWSCPSRDKEGNYICKYTEDIKEKDCPKCSRPMFRRKNNRDGSIFLACSGFKAETNCNYTESLS